MKDKSIIIGPPFSIAELANMSDVFDFTKFLPRTFADAEKQWCIHLLGNGDLTSPVYFNQDSTHEENGKSGYSNCNTFQKCRAHGR